MVRVDRLHSNRIYLPLSNFLNTTEKAGKTIHLLKAGSKVQAGGKKRRKVELLGTIDEYKESKKKP